MTTGIIGVGQIGSAVAEHLVAGNEPVVLAAKSESAADELAERLGERARPAPVVDAISEADAIVLAVPFDAIKELIGTYSSQLAGKVVIDPSNPITADDKGGFVRTLPDGVSAGSGIAELLPPDAHYVKAFGTISAVSLASAANRTPKRAVLFYATDDDWAGSVAERLISAAGFEPVKLGGIDQTLRIEVFGDLHEFGGLEGRLLDADQARAAIAAAEA